MIKNLLLITGLIISLFFGIWHFGVPYIYKWYSYIPNAPKAIVVSIDWINYFFSLLLTGISFLLLIFYKRISIEKSTLFFYILLLFTWLSRILITIIRPWGYDIIFVIQLIIFTSEFIILLIPLIIIIKEIKKKQIRIK